MAPSESLPVRQARDGDPQAWDALFRRYQKPLYVYAVELVRDEQTALEIVQETFIAAIRHIASLREDSRFGSWLFGIAHQKCLQSWRKTGRQQAALQALEEEEWSEEPFEAPDEWLIRKEQEACVLRSLESLPSPQRSVLLLFYLENFSLEEIAEATGAPVGSVKSRLHYAKKALRRAIEDNL